MSSNNLDRSLLMDAVRVTEAAAIASCQRLAGVTKRPLTKPLWTRCVLP